MSTICYGFRLHGRRAVRYPHTRRAGYTLLELIVVLVISAILLGLAAVRATEAADRSAVHAAAGDVAAVMTTARSLAIYRRAPVAVAIDTLAGALVVRQDTSLLFRRDLRSSYGVGVVASRDSTAFDARGLGVGAANLSLVLRRGAAVDTVFLSRLGRVR
jgi:prepilin-type N-terminal cleavage/methylation domain-containing protein